MKYASFWTRLGAYLFDGLVIFALQILLGMVRLGMLGILASVAYFIYFWTQKDGETLGNKVLKIKVVREDGKRIDFFTAFIRYVGYIVSTIPLLLGFLWVFWDKKRQGWHDKMAGTVVVHK